MLARTTSVIHANRLSLTFARHLETFQPNVRPIDVPSLAFALDIDGVLLQGSRVLPEAKRALALLENENNSLGIKIPYILMTNGGGIGEAERCAKLTQQLGVNIRPTQFLQSHTILKALSPKFANDPVLVLGGKFDNVRRVAEGYGYRKAYTTADVLAWNPSLWPFHDLSPAELQITKVVDFSKTRFSAVFVFHDPRNWALDVQILCDVINSNGFLGNPSPSSNDKAVEPIELVFCNPDLVWRSDFHHPRLGQGAFKETFQAVFKALTGSTYPYTQYGKPTKATFKFAESLLADNMEELCGRRTPLPHIYMIGDNPASDIAGANAANWSSVLVHTGVFDPSAGPPSHRPTREAPDVEAAVRWAIEKEMKNVVQ